MKDKLIRPGNCGGSGFPKGSDHAITKLLKTAAAELENSEFERRRDMALEEIQEFTDVYPYGYLEEIRSEWSE